MSLLQNPKAKRTIPFNKSWWKDFYGEFHVRDDDSQIIYVTADVALFC